MEQSRREYLPEGWSFSRAVRARTSIRTYEETSLSEEVRADIDKLLADPVTPPFKNPVRFKLLDLAELPPEERSAFGTYGFIRGARYFIVTAVKKGPKSMEDLGYALEEIILLLTARGLGTCWLGGTFKRSRLVDFFEIQTDEVLPAITPVGYPAKRRALTDRLIHMASGASSRKPWEKLFFGPSYEPLSKQEAGVWEEPLECVRLAPSASNRQPWRVVYRPGGGRPAGSGCLDFYLKRTPGYGTLTGGVSLQDIDMGIAMCHFECAVRETGLSGGWEGKNNPGAKWDYITSWMSPNP